MAGVVNIKQKHVGISNTIFQLQKQNHKNMFTQELINKILSKRGIDNEKSDYYKNLFISLKVLDYSAGMFFKTLPLSDKFQAYGYAKLTVFELWTVRIILTKLGLDLSYFDKELFPDIKSFRDALAHLDERIEGNIRINRKNVPVKWETQTVADGKLTSSDGGKSWIGKGSLFNISFDGSKGAHSPFGLVNDHLIINTEEGMLDYKLTPEVFKKLNDWLFEKLK